MSHALVFWIGENKYSVVSIKKVNFDGQTVNDVNLIVGSIFKVKWKKQWYDAEIKAVGTKLEMEEQEGVWEAHATDRSFEVAEVIEAGGGDYVNESFIVQDDGGSYQSVNEGDGEFNGDLRQSEAVGDTGENPEESQVEWAMKRIQDLEQEIKKKDVDLAKERAKNKNLRRMAKKSAKHDMSSEAVKIGGNLTIPKSVDDFLKASYRNNASLFFRKLISEGGVISVEELASSSLTGKRTNHSPAEGARPGLDPQKFKVLKDYTIASCSLQPKTLEMLQFENKIRNICTDARKKLKTVHGN